MVNGVNEGIALTEITEDSSSNDDRSGKSLSCSVSSIRGHGTTKTFCPLRPGRDETAGGRALFAADKVQLKRWEWNNGIEKKWRSEGLCRDVGGAQAMQAEAGNWSNASCCPSKQAEVRQ